ncbi:MAG: hypothetical protein ABL985_16200 [Casimicrobium sp.]
MKSFNFSRLLRRLCAALAVMTVAACTQAPTTGPDTAAAKPTSPVAPIIVVPPVVAKVEPKPVAPAAIPPVDGSASSVTANKGSVAPVRVQPSAVEIATTPSVTPSGATRYECVRGAQGAESRVAIAFPENSGRICARFPAMGPCQYERSSCRSAGGRVIRFDGVEITKEVEHEYDKQVTRFRLNAG